MKNPPRESPRIHSPFTTGSTTQPAPRSPTVRPTHCRQPRFHAPPGYGHINTAGQPTPPAHAPMPVAPRTGVDARHPLGAIQRGSKLTGTAMTSTLWRASANRPTASDPQQTLDRLGRRLRRHPRSALIIDDGLFDATESVVVIPLTATVADAPMIDNTRSGSARTETSSPRWPRIPR